MLMLHPGLRFSPQISNFLLAILDFEPVLVQYSNLALEELICGAALVHAVPISPKVEGFMSWVWNSNLNFPGANVDSVAYNPSPSSRIVQNVGGS
jgi:hypothetical protein